MPSASTRSSKAWTSFSAGTAKSPSTGNPQGRPISSAPKPISETSSPVRPSFLVFIIPPPQPSSRGFLCCHVQTGGPAGAEPAATSVRARAAILGEGGGDCKGGKLDKDPGRSARAGRARPSRNGRPPLNCKLLNTQLLAVSSFRLGFAWSGALP